MVQYFRTTPVLITRALLLPNPYFTHPPCPQNRQFVLYCEESVSWFAWLFVLISISLREAWSSVLSLTIFLFLPTFSQLAITSVIIIVKFPVLVSPSDCGSAFPRYSLYMSLFLQPAGLWHHPHYIGDPCACSTYQGSVALPTVVPPPSTLSLSPIRSLT